MGVVGVVGDHSCVFFVLCFVFFFVLCVVLCCVVGLRLGAEGRVQIGIRVAYPDFACTRNESEQHEQNGAVRIGARTGQSTRAVRRDWTACSYSEMTESEMVCH